MKESYKSVPDRTIRSINRYVTDGMIPGDFLTAVLENKLVEAFSRADLENLNALEDIVRYVYNEIPMDCWGSEEEVKQWVKAHEEKRSGSDNGENK
jgi:hypothetical protein